MIPAPVPVWPANPAVSLPPAMGAARPVCRRGRVSDAPGIHALIMASLSEGHLLPRSLANVLALADRFALIERQGVVLACGELAPLSATVAEVRSLVVHPDARGLGLGRVVIDELRRRARGGRFRTVCAFTHGPEFFVKLGFSIVPHSWLPEKVASDCWNCARFPHCGQYAMVTGVADDSSAAALRSCLS
jgi:amino-acid N-acetyltransferase